jgi:hypothetical protein
MKEVSLKKKESVKKVLEVMAEDLSKRLVYLSISLNLSAPKLVSEINLLTNESFTKYHLNVWKKRGDKLVSQKKVKQLNAYFKAKGLSLLRSSMDEFKESVDEHLKDISGEGKDFYERNEQDKHPHTKVIDSFDNLELAEVKPKDNGLSEKDFLSITFKNLLNLDKDEFEKKKIGHEKLKEIYICVERMNWIGG